MRFDMRLTSHFAFEELSTLPLFDENIHVRIQDRDLMYVSVQLDGCIQLSFYDSGSHGSNSLSRSNHHV